MANPQQLLGAAREHAVEGVVVVGGNGVVLVVVATGAGDGQAHRGAGDRIDAVVDDVVRDAEEASAQGQKAHRRLGAEILWSRLIRGELQQEKTVVRQIVVEGLDHPIAVCGRVHPDAMFAGVDVALRVGVAGEVEPAAGLSFTVVW